MNKPSDIGSALVQSMRRADLQDLTVDYAQAGLDAELSEGVLKEIPVVRSILALGKIGLSFRDRLLINKILSFLLSLNELPADERDKMVAKLESDAAYGRRVGIHVVELLERIDSHRKPAMVAFAFAAYAKQGIDAKMLHRLLNAIERLPTTEIDAVRPWSIATTAEAYLRIDPESFHAFTNAGLSNVESLASGLAYRPNKTCETFLKLNLDVRSR
jgi:hypothetical protein